MLSNETKITIIADIIHDHVKGKHKDKISKELAEQIVKELSDYDE